MTRLLIGMSGGLYGWDDESGDAPTTLLPGVQVNALAVDPSTPRRIYCATYNRGLWRSQDAGRTWLPVGTPQDYSSPARPGAIGPRETTFVSVSPQPDASGRQTVWVGTEPSRLYKSIDHAETFELVTTFDLPSRTTWAFPPRPSTHHVHWIAHGADDQLYISVEAGALLRSRDGGRTFEDRVAGSPLDTHILRTHPLAPGRLYAALGDGLLTRGHSFGESRDGGETWQYFGKGLETTPYLYGLAVNPGDPDDMRVSASSGIRAAHAGGPSSMFRREGDAWFEDAAGFPRDHSLIPVLAADPLRPGV